MCIRDSIGVGGFHRAHEAAYLDQLMNEGKALDWGVSGVGLLASDRRMHEVMTAQDCLYTLVIKHPDGSLHPRVVGSIIASSSPATTTAGESAGTRPAPPRPCRAPRRG